MTPILLRVFFIQEVDNSLINCGKSQLNESSKIYPPKYFHFSIFMFSLQYSLVPNKCYPPPNLLYHHLYYFLNLFPILPQCIFGLLRLLIWTTTFVLRVSETDFH